MSEDFSREDVSSQETITNKVDTENLAEADYALLGGHTNIEVNSNAAGDYYKLSLLDMIINDGKLSETKARSKMKDICSALQYCHNNGICHRDIKLENILVSPTGALCISDFHIATTFTPGVALTRVCGTSYFPAPELLALVDSKSGNEDSEKNCGYDGTKVDAWSVGIVLYTCVNGKVPWDAPTMEELNAKRRELSLEIPRELSPECRELLSRLLAQDPISRPSMREILDSPWMNMESRTILDRFQHWFKGSRRSTIPGEQYITG